MFVQKKNPQDKRENKDANVNSLAQYRRRYSWAGNVVEIRVYYFLLEFEVDLIVAVTT